MTFKDLKSRIPDVNILKFFIYKFLYFFSDISFLLLKFKWRDFGDLTFRKNRISEPIDDSETILVDHFDYIRNVSYIFSTALGYQKRYFSFSLSIHSLFFK